MHGGPDWLNFDRGWAETIDVVPDNNGFTAEIYILRTLAVSPVEGSHFTVPDRVSLSQIGAMVYPKGAVHNGDSYRVIIAPHHDYIQDEIRSLRYDGSGYAPADYYFVITPQYIYYRDGNASLAVPVGLVSAWALQQGNLEEIFDHLALHNRYFSSIVAPAFLWIFIVFFVSQTVIILTTVWLFGYWQKILGNMNIRERFAVCTFASVPAGILAFAVGIFFPVFHIFLFQFGMIYFTYKSMKEFFNAQSRLVEQVL
jgi:hypothetical protein